HGHLYRGARPPSAGPAKRFRSATKKPLKRDLAGKQTKDSATRQGFSGRRFVDPRAGPDHSALAIRALMFCRLRSNASSSMTGLAGPSIKASFSGTQLLQPAYSRALSIV